MLPDETHQQFFEELTEREHEIVQLIAQGLTNREIARDLALSYETVKWYTKRIYSKLHVTNRTQLILLVQQSKIPGRSQNTTHTLPRMLTRFIGRRGEIDELIHLLRQERLITLVGSGGIGKTRLAIEVGSRQRQFQQVMFIPLHTVDSEEQFIATLSNAFGISLSGPDQPLARLLSALPQVPILLILDNFETVIGAAPFLTQMLRRAEHLTILVTSRSVLHLQAEVVYMVEGLQLEGTDLDEQSAVDLFLERATHHPNLDFHNERPIIQEICRTLDGSPLAIELAASWGRALRPQQILAELYRGLDILRTNLVDVDERHCSMVAVCEYSWRMLTEQEQAVFEKLSVFRSGFSSEAALAVAGASMPVLAALGDKSMLRLANDGRYQIHDVLLIFARQRLNENPAQAMQGRQRHAYFFLDLLTDAAPKLCGWELRHFLQVIEDDLDNIVAAWNWIVENEPVDKVERVMQPLARFLSITDRSRQGSAMFSRALEHATRGTGVYAGLLLFRGWHEIWLGNTDHGTSDMFQALALLDDLNLSALWAMPISVLSFNEGFDATTRGKLRERYQRDREIYQESKDDWNVGWMEYSLGNIARANNLLEQSREFLQRSLQCFQKMGDLYGQAWALDALSTTYRRMKAHDEAMEVGMQLKAISELVSYNTGLVIAFEVFGEVAEVRGDYQGAYTNYRQALQHALKNADPTTIIPIVMNIARLVASHSTLPKYVAVELFAIVKSHPSSQLGWFAFRHIEAEDWLEKLHVHDSTSGYYTAILRGQAADLVRAIRRLLDEVLPATI